MRGWLVRAGVAAIMSVTVAGCSSPVEPVLEPEPPPYVLPEGMGYSFVWSAAPGLDLLSPELVAARAMIESVSAAFTAGELAGGYPGFERAAAQWDGRDLLPSRRQLDSRRGQRVEGSTYIHVLRIEETSVGSVHVVYCSRLQGAVRQVDGKYVVYAQLGDSADDIEMRPPHAREQWRTSSGAGEARYPVTDVFGEWLLLSWITDIGHTRADNQACVDRFAGMPYVAPGVYDEPPPMMPPYPGWPSLDEQ